MSGLARTLRSIAACFVAAALGLVLLAGCGGTSSPSSETTANTTGSSFALPLADDPASLEVAEHAGNVLVGLAAAEGGPVEVVVLRAETPVETDELDLEVDGSPVDATGCGDGCSRIETAVLDGTVKRIDVRAGSATVRFELPAHLPPDGAAVFARAQKTMDALRTFRFTERLTSGSGGVTTDFDVQAPNRLRLRTADGFRAVIIGRTRWDYTGGQWERGSFPGLTVPQVLMWNRARNPRIVERRADGTAELAAFGLQPVPAWFRLTVEPDGRVVEAEMIAASHFMTHSYGDFNGRFAIEPPR